jgi:chemotaxis protein CheD
MKRYGAERTPPDPEPVTVGIADVAVTTDGSTLSTSGLGSCVAVALHDGAEIAGLVHAMLPRADDGTDENPAKYADEGVRVLYDSLVSAGARESHLVAKIAGGSHMFDFSDADNRIGARNVAAARETLADLGVRTAAEDVGGDRGRSVKFDPETGDLQVRSAGATVVTL